MRNRTLWICALALLCAGVAMGQGAANDPGARDTLFVGTVQVDPGHKAVVDVNFYSDEELAALTIPLLWSSPDVTLDSVSFVGSRISYISTKPVSIYNNIQTTVFGAIVFLEVNIAPGTGLMAKLYFDVPSGIPDQIVNIDSTRYPPAELLFTNPNSTNFTPVMVPGKIQVGNPSHIVLSPTSMVFEGTVGGSNPPGQPLSVSNAGPGPMPWTASSSAGWLSANPPSGTAPSLTSIRVNVVGLTEGTYNGTITISAPGADNTPQNVQVTLNMTRPAPTIAYSPKSFSVSAVQGGANPADRYLKIWTSVAESDLDWTVSHSSSWLTISPTSGTPPDSVTLQFDISGLTYGYYYDTIVISDPHATNNPQHVPVTLQVVSDLPVLALDPPILHVVAAVGTDATGRAVMVYNSGAGAMTFQTYESSKYIVGITPSSGSAPQEILINFKTSIMDLGDYYDTVTVTSPEAINSPQYLIIHYHISTSPARLVMLPGSMSYTYYECWQGPGAIPPTRTFQIVNTGDDDMNWRLTHKESWLVVNPDSGFNAAFVSMTLHAEGFPLGTYYDTIVAYSDEAINSPQRMPVRLNVVPGTETPEIVVENTAVDIPAQEIFGTTYGLAHVAEIYNLYPGCMDYRIGEDIPWLLFIDSVGNAPAIPKVSFDIGTYTYGVYHDSFYVYSSTASNSPEKAYLNLLVWRYHGDFDWSGNINVADIVMTLNYVFKSGPGPQPEYAVGDCNCDEWINIEDIFVLLFYVFQNGDPPCGNPQ